MQIYDNDFKNIEDEGNIKNGKKDGIWKGSIKKPQTTFTETYQNGGLISGKATFSDSTTAVYTKSRGMEPVFTGGVAAFTAYLGNNIRYPDYERGHNIQGVVIISFIVEKDGKVTEIKVNKSVSKGLDKEAVRVISNSPHWIAGTMFGRPVRIAYSVPVNFSLTN